MKTVGMFEAKTRFSEICQEVAESREPVVVTRRGEPMVQIDPVASGTTTIRERRAKYMTRYGKKERPDKRDFEPAPRSQEIADFQIED